MAAPQSPAQPGPINTAAAGGAKPLVMVIEDETICRDLICHGLREGGFEVVTACDGEAGLIELEACAPQLILLDNEMPRMNGLTFLRALRQHKRYRTVPVVMLTVANAKEIIIEAIRLKVAGYVLKEHMVMEELLHRLRHVLIKDLPKADELTDARSKRGKPDVPNLVKREITLAALIETDLVTLLMPPDGPATGDVAGEHSEVDLADIIRQDPVLAAGIIEQARNAGMRETADLAEALQTVGLPAARKLSRAISLNALCRRDRGDTVGVLRCWQHALAVATVMARIVPPETTDAAAAHLVGLCHDLPELLLRQRFPREFSKAASYALKADVAPAAMLQPVFGVSYNELAALLFEKLKFPTAAVDALGDFHRQAADAPFDSFNDPLARALAVADKLAHGMILTGSAEALVAPVETFDCRGVAINPAAIGTADIRVETITTVSMLAELTGERDKQLSTPLLGRRDKKLLYVRQGSFAALDPLEAALRSLGAVDVTDKPVWPDQLRKYDGVVITAPQASDPLFTVMDTMRAQMNPPMPNLKLVSSVESSASSLVPETVAVQRYPISLAALANFVHGLPKRLAAAA